MRAKVSGRDGNRWRIIHRIAVWFARHLDLVPADTQQAVVMGLCSSGNAGGVKLIRLHHYRAASSWHFCTPELAMTSSISRALSRNISLFAGHDEGALNWADPKPTSHAHPPRRPLAAARIDEPLPWRRVSTPADVNSPQGRRQPADYDTAANVLNSLARIDFARIAKMTIRNANRSTISTGEDILMPPNKPAGRFRSDRAPRLEPGLNRPGKGS